MNEVELHERVDQIIAAGGDDEVAHAREDDLHLELIKQFCPEWVVKEVNRLSAADFERWCA